MSDPFRHIREPSAAGKYYPKDPEALKTLIDRLLEQAECRLEPDRELRALMCPHARLEDAGSVAAEAFVCIKGRPITTVVLVGPDHYIGFEWVAVYPSGAFRTPLGDVWVDEELADIFVDAGPEVRAAPEAHS